MGKRTGRPKGTKGWDKARQHQLLRERFFAAQDALVDAQIANGLGIKYLVAREKKSGKFVEVTQEQVQAILAGKDSDHEMLEVWEKQASTPAFKELADRAIGKPAEVVELNANHQGEITFRWAGK